MEIEAVAIPRQAVSETATSAALLSVMRDLWDLQPSRYQGTSLEQSERIAGARQALRAGNSVLAQRLLLDLKTPDALNLSGLAHEVMGNHKKARHLYQRALIGDRDLYAAELNLRRSFELWEYGQSDIPFAL
jgi:hypothetical protein